MDKKGIALITLFMVFIGFQAAAPAAAVKVIDHGTHYFTYENSNMKEVWKTYQYNNNFIKEYALFYYKKTGKYHFAFHEVTTITKVNKSTVKIKEWTDSIFVPGSDTRYAKTKLTSAQYYWRTYRPEMLI